MSCKHLIRIRTVSGKEYCSTCSLLLIDLSKVDKIGVESKNDEKTPQNVDNL